MFWADKLAEDTKNLEYVWVDDMATPSGRAHVGSLRGAIIHDVAAKAARQKNSNVKFTFFSNDFDPMDGMPSYLDPKVYDKYMGQPMFTIPAPVGDMNFADYYIDELYEIMRNLGCEFEIMKDSIEYKNGTYDEVIKEALDNAEKIRKVYKEVSGSEKPKDWYPFQPVCEKCGKIGTTKVYDWDGKEVSYRCEENMVEWAKGCGYEGKISPFGGNGKMPWKVEWPAKWKALGINVEGEGKDHASSGGSRDLANHLCKEVFNIVPPFDIPYEHIIFGGKKMSKSKGVGISAKDAYESLAPEILRFVMIRNPERVIDLDLSGMAIPTLFEEYDRALKAYNKEVDFPDLASAFFYSQVSEKFNTGFKPRFTKLAHALQMPNINIEDWAKQEKGEELSNLESDELNERIKYAKLWLEKFAPEEFKFQITKEEPKKELNEAQKTYLSLLTKKLEAADWKADELQSLIFETTKEAGVEPKIAFSSIYIALLDKESGPQAGLLLSSLEKDFVLNRFSKLT